jgi:hypothetical protein
MDDYLANPVRPVELYETIERVTPQQAPATPEAPADLGEFARAAVAALLAPRHCSLPAAAMQNSWPK